MRSPSTREKQHPFRALGLSQSIIEKDIAREFGAKMKNECQTILTSSPRPFSVALRKLFTPLDIFTFTESESALTPWMRSSSLGLDGLTYSILTHLGMNTSTRLQYSLGNGIRSPKLENVTCCANSESRS